MNIRLAKGLEGASASNGASSLSFMSFLGNVPLTNLLIFVKKN